MLRDRHARRRAITFIVLLALCLVMLAISGSGPVQELRRGVNFAVSPVQDTLSESTRSVTDVLGALGEIDRLRHENRDLQARVDELEDELATMESVQAENARLSRILKTQRSLERETVAARVTGRHSSQFERVITLDKGEEAGIIKGAPVLSPGGALAGAITEVGPGYASVQLISDTRSLVIGLVNRTRATGEVIGRLSSPLAMSNIPITDEVAAGDRIVTAGINLGRRFRSFYPKGLPIGRVVGVEQEPGSIVQTALLQSAADLEHLETVLVITDFKPPKRRPSDEADEG
jgi:rod shape-determining protein MreC